jgi:hypothetical protein
MNKNKQKGDKISKKSKIKIKGNEKEPKENERK